MLALNNYNCLRLGRLKAAQTGMVSVSIFATLPFNSNITSSIGIHMRRLRLQDSAEIDVMLTCHQYLNCSMKKHRWLYMS